MVLPLPVDSPIQIDPGGLSSYIRFRSTRQEAPTDRAIALPALQEVWHVPLHPAQDRGVRYIEMSLRHHLQSLG